MRFLILGLLVGSLSAFMPFLHPSGGFELYPEWTGRIGSPHLTEVSPNARISKLVIPPVVTDKGLFLIAGSGALLKELDTKESLIAMSRNGRYYIRYQKVGSSIEFMGREGEKFWKLKSMEYPYLSSNGRLILLLNGDHSRIRTVDYNGNAIGEGEISGRFCTIIAFSKKSDFSAIGFLDGSYCALDARGMIIHSGTVEKSRPVKSIGISDSGQFMAVHCGGGKNDLIKVIDIAQRDACNVELSTTHLTKTALWVTDRGTAAIIDYNRLVLVDDDGDAKSIPIPEKRSGHSCIDHERGLYVLSYTKKTGEAFLLLIHEEGTVLGTWEFPEESFLDCYLEASILYARGSKNLYCYRYHRQ